MNKNLFIFIVCFLFISINSFAQENSIQEWDIVLKENSLSNQSLLMITPNFPDLETIKNSEELNRNLRKWVKLYPQEWKELDEKFHISKKHSLIYLGLYNSKEYEKIVNEQFHHSWLDAILATNISDRRLKEFAPHFPEFRNRSETELKETFEKDFERWKILYSHEYENLVNAREITAQNPYFEEYIDIIKIPYFIGPLSSEEKPKKENTGNKFEDDLKYELSLMNWYFVFQPNKFYVMYGFIPEFPENFDVENYRKNIKEKILNNKENNSSKN